MAGDERLKYDYTTILSKREEVLTKKIEKEIALFEDDDEGWTYHITAHDDRLRQSGKWWCAIVYPESVPPNWIDKLRAKGYAIAISPLHDKDTWNHDSPAMVNAETGELIPVGARYKTGDRKKAHWHIIIISEVKVHFREINKEIQDITHCPYVQKCRSLKNSYEYFLHINAPEKYQGYDKNEIQTYNNFRIEPNKFEQAEIYGEAIETIIEKQFTDWTEVIKFYKNSPEYILVLTNKPSVVTETLKVNWRRKNPEGIIQKTESRYELNAVRALKDIAGSLRQLLTTDTIIDTDDNEKE